ncbi:hypothetical protein KXS15_09530 [Sinorhizobium meliloti]|uniref:DUF6953 family protein n=1 Tax=Rhizobium meliloti TaxID=382 RepID=UPI003F15345C
MSARDVAQWMVDQMGTSARLYQETIVRKIKKHWGDDYVYKNQNGNLAISKEVLKEFKALTEESLVWERGERAWRRKRPGENSRSTE